MGGKSPSSGLPAHPRIGLTQTTRCFFRESHPTLPMSHLPDSHRSSTLRPVAVRHQVGLKAIRVSHRHAGWVNVEDPVAGKYHRLREDEYFLLCQLDGSRSLEQLRDDYQTRYPNRRVTPAQINSLLFRFHESGLTISNASGQGDPLLLRSDKERRKKWLALASQWLFIRLPGMDPAPIMRWLSPLVRPLLSPVGFAASVTFVIVTAIAMVVRYEDFVRELPSASQWLTFSNAILLAVVVGVTKMAHELGHAAVSERFGAKCRSIGPMLLVFTPALYCDTSSSWMLASRWKRAAVGLAGIGTEVLIASLAAWVWMATGPGWMHTTASHVIVVCGISTVLFNANPLLRYDGYYVLSDLSDVPNLGQRANRRLSSLMSKHCLGIDQTNTPTEPADHSWWMLFYAIASLVYRWTLMFTIIVFIWMALRPYGLEIVGQMAALMAGSSMIVAAAMPLSRFLKNPANRRKVRMHRLILTSLAVAALIGLTMIPYASPCIATARIVPRHETRVFVASAGQLKRWHTQPGQQIAKDDLIAELRNPSLDSQWVQANGRLAEQSIRIETLRQSQTLVPEASEHLAAAEETLAQLREELADIQRKQEALQIKSPSDGIVIAAPGNRAASNRGSVNDSPTFDDSVLDPDADRLPSLSRADIRMASWSGHPTDLENVDCFFEAGTELLSIADPDDWVVEAPVDAALAAKISMGADAEVIWDGSPDEVWPGKVIEISDERFDPKLDSVRRDHPSGSQNQWTPKTRFLVRVSLDAPTAPAGWLVGSTGRVKIATPSRSLSRRTIDSIASLLRFR